MEISIQKLIFGLPPTHQRYMQKLVGISSLTALKVMRRMRQSKITMRRMGQPKIMITMRRMPVRQSKIMIGQREPRYISSTCGPALQYSRRCFAIDLRIHEGTQICSYQAMIRKKERMERLIRCICSTIIVHLMYRNKTGGESKAQDALIVPSLGYWFVQKTLALESSKFAIVNTIVYPLQLQRILPVCTSLYIMLCQCHAHHSVLSRGCYNSFPNRASVHQKRVLVITSPYN